MDITEIILHQHMEQRRTFAMLDEVPREDTKTLGSIWNRLQIFLENHADAEERFFYPHLLKLGTGSADADSVEEEVEDAVKDHNQIRDAIQAASASEVGSSSWFDAVTRCRIENDDHMAEEERQDLADFRLHASLQLRHDIAVDFLRYESQHAAKGIIPRDRDPEQYIEQAGQTA